MPATLFSSPLSRNCSWSCHPGFPTAESSGRVLGLILCDLSAAFAIISCLNYWKTFQNGFPASTFTALGSIFCSALKCLFWFVFSRLGHVPPQLMLLRPRASRLTQGKSQNSYNGPHCAIWSGPITSLLSSAGTVFPVSSEPASGPPCCSSDTPILFLTQTLCPYKLFPEESSLRSQWPSPPFPQLSAQMLPHPSGCPWPNPT